ncbi:MAG TPA: type II toxin-antitoxin system Phd/YefM family antitoxin [Candidatus Dormibacteraeota bacterium]
MTRVGVHQAKTRLSELLRRVASGEEIVIMRGADPIAKLVPVASGRQRRLGIDRGKLTVPDDFDAPLPDEVLDGFEQ